MRLEITGKGHAVLSYLRRVEEIPEAAERLAGLQFQEFEDQSGFAAWWEAGSDPRTMDEFINRHIRGRHTNGGESAA